MICLGKFWDLGLFRVNRFIAIGVITLKEEKDEKEENMKEIWD